MWFTHKQSALTQLAKQDTEIVAHKNARKETAEMSKEASDNLKKLLVANGFTLKIYLAAGGSHPSTHKGNH